MENFPFGNVEDINIISQDHNKKTQTHCLIKTILIPKIKEDIPHSSTIKQCFKVMSSQDKEIICQFVL